MKPRIRTILTLGLTLTLGTLAAAQDPKVPGPRSTAPPPKIIYVTQPQPTPPPKQPAATNLPPAKPPPTTQKPPTLPPFAQPPGTRPPAGGAGFGGGFAGGGFGGNLGGGSARGGYGIGGSRSGYGIGGFGGFGGNGLPGPPPLVPNLQGDPRWPDGLVAKWSFSQIGFDNYFTAQIYDLSLRGDGSCDFRDKVYSHDPISGRWAYDEKRQTVVVYLPGKHFSAEYSFNVERSKDGPLFIRQTHEWLLDERLIEPVLFDSKRNRIFLNGGAPDKPLPPSKRK